MNLIINLIIYLICDNRNKYITISATIINLIYGLSLFFENFNIITTN